MAAEWQNKQALLPSIARGNLQDLNVALSPHGLPTTPTAFKPTGLAPQKVVKTDEGDPTRDTYQRKVFYDGTNFFVVYWTGAPTREVRYVVSADGKTWTVPVTLWTFSVAPYFGGNVDIQYPNRGAKDMNGEGVDLSMTFTGSNGGTSSWRPFIISGQTLTVKLARAQGGLVGAQGGNVVANLDGIYEFILYHESTLDRIGLHGNFSVIDYDTSISYGGTTTGGAQIVPYKTSSPYDMLCLAKGADNKLYWNIIKEDTRLFANSSTEITTLGTGFSDFCACSEAQNSGDPEKIHLVYIKSSGELCYRKFQNDAWSAEKILIASGASYSVIAAGNNGKLYVFFVKSGKIWVIHYNGTRWFNAVELFTADHTYTTPAYLSCNQNVQSSKICLVWCEPENGTYAVWFCYLEE